LPIQCYPKKSSQQAVPFGGLRIGQSCFFCAKMPLIATVTFTVFEMKIELHLLDCPAKFCQNVYANRTGGSSSVLGRRSYVC
jgi:hypothetical protein